MVNVFHLNLGKRTNACDILGRNLRKYKNAVISINEPPLNLKINPALSSPFCRNSNNRRTRAAVYLKGDQYKGILLDHLSTPDVAVVSVSGEGFKFTVISAYLPPYDDEYQQHLSELQFAIDGIEANEKLIICTDSNARNTLWSDVLTNRRGNEFETFATTNELYMLNTEGPHTYCKLAGDEERKGKRVTRNKPKRNVNGKKKQDQPDKEGKSVIDLVLANYQMMDLGPVTEVLDIYTGSDHRMIRTELEVAVEGNSETQQNPFRSTTRIWRTDVADWLIYDQTLERNAPKLENTNFDVASPEEADLALEVLNDYLEEACDAAMPRLKNKSTRKPNENDEINKLTKLEYNLANRIKRLETKNAFLAGKVKAELVEVQRLKTEALNRHRKTCFEEACAKASHPSEAYKLHKNCKDKFTRSCPATILDGEGKPTKDSQETIEKLFMHSFPDKNHPKPPEPITITEPEPTHRITTEEIERALRWMPNNKAPGIDGFSPIIIKRALPRIIGAITTLFNALLRLQYFPKAWKKGFAIFIPKPGSNEGPKTVKDFRPITLLNVLAKLFEKLIIIRINKHMYSNNKMNENQEGFRHQRGTAHALHSLRNFIIKNKKLNRSTIAVFLDISGAFDNACWQVIIRSLGKNDCPRYLINLIVSYFKDREVTTNSHNSKLQKTLTQGCPQGSCCGPSLWNILLNNIFDLDEIRSQLGCDDFLIKAFADDIALAFAFQDGLGEKRRIEAKIESTLNSIHKWGREFFLDFNVKKTQAILFKNKPSSLSPVVRMNKVVVELKSKVKYLGVWFDSEMTFHDHANATVDKCKTIFNIMRCYSGKIWGLNPTLTRLIYRTIIIPVLTYGASIWYPALTNQKVCNKIRTLQYNCCKSITQSYRTASIISTNLLSNTLPLEYEIFIRSHIELSRVTGNIPKQVLNNQLVDMSSYKPKKELFTNRYLLENFDREASTVDVTQPEVDLVGDPNALHIEPRVRWADLPIGTEQAEINLIEYSPEAEAQYDLTIYTDGSKIGNYGTGSGFIVVRSGQNLIEASAPLHPLCSVPQAEIFAIQQSLLFVYHNYRIDNRKILVCTDSQCTLHNLMNIFSDNLIRYQIIQLISLIGQRNGRIYFAKVRAHSAIQGNEDADRCAKLASEVSAKWNREPVIMMPQFSYLPLSLVKLLIRNQFKNAWLTRPFDKEFKDDRADLNEWTVSFIPNSNCIGQKLVELCDHYTTQIVTRHGENMQYFSEFGISDNNRCVLHPDLADTPEHILFNCNPNYSRTLRRMGISSRRDLHKILENDVYISRFKGLCKTIVTDRKELNTRALCEAKNRKLALTPAKKARGRTSGPIDAPKQVRNPYYRPEIDHNYCKARANIYWINGIAPNRKPSNSNDARCDQNVDVPTATKRLAFPRGNPKEGIKLDDKRMKVRKRTIYKNDGTIPTAHAVITSFEKDNTIISDKHGITASSWLSGEQILKFGQNCQAALGRTNCLIIDPLIFAVSEDQLVDHLRVNVSQEIEIIMVIIHINGNHWIIGLINLNNKTIAILDSLGETNHGKLFNKLYRAAALCLVLQGKRQNFGDFKFKCSLNNPKQMNNDDCGVVVCRIMKAIMDRDPEMFEIQTGDFRTEIASMLDNEFSRPPSNMRRGNRELANKFKQANFIARTDGYGVKVQIVDYIELIKLYTI